MSRQAPKAASIADRGDSRSAVSRRRADSGGETLALAVGLLGDGKADALFGVDAEEGLLIAARAGRSQRLDRGVAGHFHRGAKEYRFRNPAEAGSNGVSARRRR